MSKGLQATVRAGLFGCLVVHTGPHGAQHPTAGLTSTIKVPLSTSPCRGLGQLPFIGGLGAERWLQERNELRCTYERLQWHRTKLDWQQIVLWDAAGRRYTPCSLWMR